MQNRKHITDSRIESIRQAFVRKMKKNKHSQLDVSRISGVPQSTISRFLSGKIKRISKNIVELCKYAKIDPALVLPLGQEERRLSHVLHNAIGDNPAAALILARIVESLTPLLRNCNLDPSAQPSGADHDRTRAR